MNHLPSFIMEVCRAITPVGSRTTCSPPPTTTDEDFLCYVQVSESDELERDLKADGWHAEGSDAYPLCGSDFKSYRKGDINLIVTTVKSFNHKFCVASSVCKRLNLMAKVDRVAVFRAVLYGELADTNTGELV